VRIEFSLLISKIRVVNYKLHLIVYWMPNILMEKMEYMCNSSLFYKKVTPVNILLKYMCLSVLLS
jgi:hypothetical protein